MYSVRSGLMNTYSSQESTALMPLPKSPAAASPLQRADRLAGHDADAEAKPRRRRARAGERPPRRTGSPSRRSRTSAARSGARMSFARPCRPGAADRWPRSASGLSAGRAPVARAPGPPRRRRDRRSAPSSSWTRRPRRTTWRPTVELARAAPGAATRRSRGRAAALGRRAAARTRRTSSAAGAPPCWAFGSQGPRASSVASNQPVRRRV